MKQKPRQLRPSEKALTQFRTNGTIHPFVAGLAVATPSKKKVQDLKTRRLLLRKPLLRKPLPRKPQLRSHPRPLKRDNLLSPEK